MRKLQKVLLLLRTQFRLRQIIAAVKSRLKRRFCLSLVIPRELGLVPAAAAAHVVLHHGVIFRLLGLWDGCCGDRSQQSADLQNRAV